LISDCDKRRHYSAATGWSRRKNSYTPIVHEHHAPRESRAGVVNDAVIASRYSVYAAKAAGRNNVQCARAQAVADTPAA